MSDVNVICESECGRVFISLEYVGDFFAVIFYLHFEGCVVQIGYKETFHGEGKYVKNFLTALPQGTMSLDDLLATAYDIKREMWMEWMEPARDTFATNFLQSVEQLIKAEDRANT